MTEKRMTLDDYLRHLTKMAHGYWEEHKNGTRTWHKPIPSLRNFIEHHACIGVRNGAPVWRRLDTYYLRGKKYWFSGGKFYKRGIAQ